jgi:hypothetical protein
VCTYNRLELGTFRDERDKRRKMQMRRTPAVTANDRNDLMIETAPRSIFHQTGNGVVVRLVFGRRFISDAAVVKPKRSVFSC